MSEGVNGSAAMDIPEHAAAERLPTCREVVEIIDDYLEGAMAPEESQRFELHLVWCAACRTYLEQLRESIRRTGRLAGESVPEGTRQELVRLFRDWRRETT